MGWVDRLKHLFGVDEGASFDADALDRANLRRHVVDGVARLARKGKGNADRLPPGVVVKIHVDEGSVTVVQGFVREPAFQREVDAELLNRLQIDEAGLPLCRYEVAAGGRTMVLVEETSDVALAWLVAEGLDPVPLRPGPSSYTIGRGAAHGALGVANTLALPEAMMFVSRAAAVLWRDGGVLELEARDQQDAVVVLRGERRIAPRQTARGRVRLQPGDVIELNDGRGAGGQAVRILLAATLPGRD